MKRLILIAVLVGPACLLDAQMDFPRAVVDACADRTPCPEGMMMVLDDQSHTHTPGRLQVEGGTCFCIDAYEASRSPADLPESAPERMPWVDVSFEEASAACEGAGKRLCSAREWAAACAGLPALRFPYGQDFDNSACNTTSTVTETGRSPGCEGGFAGLFDMSGNVAEWAGSTEDPGSCGGLGCAVFGGSVEFGMPDLACGLRSGFSAEERSATIGFRCCAPAM